MLKYPSAFCLLSLAACALAAGCSSDEDDGNSGASGAASTIQFGGASGQVVSFGGAGGLGSGTGGNGQTVFDGGTVPLTPAQKKAFDDAACAGWEAEGEPLTSVMELVVDISSSMNQRPGNSRQTKWEITREALLEAIVGVNGPGLPASVAVGLLFYPNRQGTINARPADINTCVNTSAMVPLSLLGGTGAPHRTLLGNAFVQARLESSTPTHDAFGHALENGLLPTRLPGQKFMLLITDGEPTLSQGCVNTSGQLNAVNPDPIVNLIESAYRDHAVRTFLIGSPGSENNRAWMSRAAILGGTAPAGCRVNGPDYCHMDMTTAPDFSAALRAGLAKIAGTVSPCVFNFAEPPAGQTIDRNKINVLLTSGSESTLVVRDDIGECSAGWQLTADNKVLLCADTCQAVQEDPTLTVDVVFGCATTQQPPR